MTASQESAATKDKIAFIERFKSGELPPPPIATFLGLRLVDGGAGTATFEMPVDERMSNPMGTLHGGILCDIADAAMGFAMATTLQDGESFTTVELKANYFKPVWRDKLTATAKILKRTRTLGFIECDVTNERGSLVGRVTSTCMVLRGEEAKGR